MKINVRNFRENLLTWGIFFYLIMISIGYLTTTELSRNFIVPARYVLVALVAICAITSIVISMIRRGQIFVISIYLLLVFYGVLLSVLNNAFEIGGENLFLNVIVTLIGVLFFTMSSNSVIPNKVGNWYISYIFVGLIFTWFVGGLLFSYPPGFIFDSEIMSDQGVQILYSQGISRYFGVGLIWAAYYIINIHGIKKIFYIGLLMIFSGLSLLGGGRGDSLAAIVIALLYVFLNSSKKILVLVIFAVSIFVVYGFGEKIASHYDVLFIQRFSVIGGGDYGMRDLLALDVWNLLLNEPRCLIYGCGFGYFQKYYEYPFGMYPHNIILEFIVIFGLPVFLSVFVGVFFGVMRYRKENSTDLFLLLFFYCLLIGLKSGNVFGDWFFTAAMMMFLVIPVRNGFWGNVFGSNRRAKFLEPVIR